MPKKIKEEITYIDSERFEKARQYVFAMQKGMQGIGSYGEKTMHSVLKNYYEADSDYQEVAINGYVADICNKDNEIIEIQTANFNKMRAKLDSFLDEYTVRIVYPIPYTKWLIWVDEETGEMRNKRKSPKKGMPYSVFYELYKIKMYLDNPNIKIDVVLVDTEEYRLLNGWSEDRKRGSCRCDRIPIGIVKIIGIDEVRDYVQMLPYELGEEFSTKDYAKVTGLQQGVASTAFNVLKHIGVIEQVRKDRNLIIYRINPQYI